MIRQLRGNTRVYGLISWYKTYPFPFFHLVRPTET